MLTKGQIKVSTLITKNVKYNQRAVVFNVHV